MTSIYFRYLFVSDETNVPPRNKAEKTPRRALKKEPSVSVARGLSQYLSHFIYRAKHFCTSM